MARVSDQARAIYRQEMTAAKSADTGRGSMASP